jgi:hypothetical protein
MRGMRASAAVRRARSCAPPTLVITSGERDLRALLSGMQPELNPERYRLHPQCSGVDAGGEANHVAAARSGAVLRAAARTSA